MKNISSLVKSYRTERHTTIKQERKEAVKKTLGLLKVFGTIGGDFGEFSYAVGDFGKERSLIQIMEDIVNEDE